MKSHLRLFALLLALVPAFAGAADPWTSSTKHTRHSLTYAAKTSLLGTETPVTVTFGCDPKSDKESSGTLGFDITIKNTGKLKAFPFDDFEGPDATVAPNIRVVVNVANKPAQTFRTTASGSYSDENAFCFSTTEVSKKSRSVPRSILQTLADNAAETVQITITDPRQPKTPLEFTIPVAGKQIAFQNLLAGLK